MTCEGWKKSQSIRCSLSNVCNNMNDSIWVHLHRRHHQVLSKWLCLFVSQSKCADSGDAQSACSCVRVLPCAHRALAHNTKRDPYELPSSLFFHFDMWKNPIGNKMENIPITESVNRKWFFSTELSPTAFCTPAHTRPFCARPKHIYEYWLSLYLRVCEASCSTLSILFLFRHKLLLFDLSHTRHCRRRCHILPSWIFFRFIRVERIILFAIHYVNTHPVRPTRESWIKYRGAYHRMVSTFITCKSAIFLDTCTFCTKNKRNACTNSLLGLETWLYFCAHTESTRSHEMENLFLRIIFTNLATDLLKWHRMLFISIECMILWPPKSKHRIESRNGKHWAVFHSLFRITVMANEVRFGPFHQCEEMMNIFAIKIFHRN